VEREEIQTLADAAQYMRERTPSPIRKWWGLKCPDCDQRFLNSLFGTWMNYEVHYMDHICAHDEMADMPS
jgi:hypothetical protein